MSGEVRQARPAELAAVLELATAFYLEEGFATPTTELRHNLRVLLQSERARVAVAVDHDHIVGFAVSTVSFGLEQGYVTELEDLFVRPGQRGHRYRGRIDQRQRRMGYIVRRSVARTGRGPQRT